MLADAVPLYGIRIRSERLELRLATPEELPRLGAAAAAGIHAPDERPYLARPGQQSWVLLPPPERARAVVMQQFAAIGAWSSDAWVLPLGVFVDDDPVGVQVVYAKHFAVTREVASSSWLTLARHGQGLGTEMREAMLVFAFALGARTALTRSFDTNRAACRVSEKVGYHRDGTEIAARENRQAHTAQRFRISVDQWRSRTRPPVVVTGLDDALSYFLDAAH
ncbi:GNAT family N-acetyltransferase [Glycomyces sp. YM15]|uniref:GNAT family N-acetyltransferase n=1 Tax=Glycomyces sp. YM15 TaxID=2800446 RepID=UPI001962A53D|nr:GNAT family protein [Glycomyces sp. YM15]